MRLCRMNRIEYRVECIKMFSADVEFALNYEMAERKSQAIVSCLLIVLIFA